MNETGMTPSWQIAVSLPSAPDTERFAHYLAPYLRAPMIITLQGEIGAGKTTFVRALLRSLGIEGPIKSPTYTLLETYDLGTNLLHHFDLYRLVDDSELDFIGFRDYFQPNTLCCIEWPERMSLPPNQIDMALLLIRSGDGRTLYIRAKNEIVPTLRQCVQSFNPDPVIIGSGGF